MNVSKMKKPVLILFLFIVCISQINGQEKERNWALNGYVKNMQTIMFSDINEDWTTDNLFHNRLNFKWYPSKSITSSVEVRNRFFYGETVKSFSGYGNLINVENGFFDLSDNLLEENSYILHSTIDRAWLDYTLDKFQVRIGRQRINWGQTMVWNPNDIFNTYSFFDFDYEEKPGSDAVRIQYYKSSTSTAEIAVKADNQNRITAAGLYKFNKWNYDLQFMGGIINGNDFVLGTGYSGQLLKGGFSGELSYFHPKENYNDTSGTYVVSIAYNYMFKNSLYLHFEGLCNSKGRSSGDFNLNEFYFYDMSAKNLSLNKFSFIAQTTYPITPLINGTFAVMYSPNDNFFFFGPTLSISLKENLDFSINAQAFTSDQSVENGGKGAFVFLRFKWSY